MISRDRTAGRDARAASVDVHSLPIGVLLFVGAQLTHSNEHWTMLTGLSETESLDDGWLAAVHPDDRALITSCALSDGQFSGGQVRLRHREHGAEVWVQPQVRSVGSPACSGAVVTMTEIGALKATEADLQYRASHDPMTGLLNKAAFLDTVDQWVAAVGGRGHEAAVHFVDLDGFKAVNDQHGHAVGDQLLIIAAERIRAAARSTDHVARLGGDEFAVFHSSVPADGAGNISERLATALSRPYSIDGQSIRITASVGLAAFAGDVTANAVVDRADRAMYRAKAAAGGRRVDDDGVPAGAGDDDGLEDHDDGWSDGGDEWSGEADEWSDGPPAGTGVPWLRRGGQVAALVVAIALLGWAAHALFAGSRANARGALSSPSVPVGSAVPSTTDPGSGTSPATTYSLERATSAPNDAGAQVGATTADTVAPASVALDATVPSAGAASPTTTSALGRPPATRGPGALPPPATSAAAPGPDVAVAGPVAPVAVTSVAPAQASSVVATSPPASLATVATTAAAAPPGTPAPVVATTSPSVPTATTTATSSAPAPTPAPAPATSFVYRVGAGDGPDQVAAWLASIGEGSLYGHTKALHHQLPVGTRIIVTNGTVSLQGP